MVTKRWQTSLFESSRHSILGFHSPIGSVPGEVSLSIESQVAVAVEHVLRRVPALSTQAGYCLCSWMLRFYQADLQIRRKRSEA